MFILHPVSSVFLNQLIPSYPSFHHYAVDCSIFIHKRAKFRNILMVFIPFYFDK